MEYINDFSEEDLALKNKYSSAGDGNDCHDYMPADVLLAINSHPELIASIVQDTFEKAHAVQ